MRRGGATAHFAACGSVSATLLRGRWASIRSGRLYIVESRAVLASLSLGTEGSRRVSRAASVAFRLLALSSLFSD